MRPPPVVPVAPPDDKLVARFAKYLAAVARAESGPLADRRFDRFLGRAERSPEATEAAWAAAQRLRDLDEIDPAEAAYVFNSIFDVNSEALCGADREYQRFLKEHVAELENGKPGDEQSHDRLMDQLMLRSRAIECEFFSARGESALAALCRDDPDAFGLLCAEGALTMVEDKPTEDEGRVAPGSQTVAARIGERILALAATETIRDALRENEALYRAMENGDPASGVTAVREMRELGAITPLEAHGLIDEIVGGVTADMQEADREWSRTDRALRSHRKALGLGLTDPWPDDCAFEIRVLEYRQERRSERLMVMNLRRFEEHELANLLLANPDEYERRRQESAVGAWAGP